MSTLASLRGVPAEVIDEWMSRCNCCPMCSGAPCGGVAQGASCEGERCTCDDEAEHEGDFADDE
jgi:hypothetical protein